MTPYPSGGPGDDGYDGKTVADGPGQTRLTGALQITKLTVGPFGNNSYLLRDRATGATLLIDAANEADIVLDTCDHRLDAVLTTHCHPDHWLALQQVVEATGARTYAGADEAPHIPVPTDVELRDGDSVPVGDTTLSAVRLVGHRRQGSDHVCGSIALVYRDPDGSSHAFTGDALFPGGVGNTCSDAASFTSLLGDVTTKLFDRLPDDTWVYPGHGDDLPALGLERPNLGQWRERGW